MAAEIKVPMFGDQCDFSRPSPEARFSRTEVAAWSTDETGEHHGNTRSSDERLIVG
jgi:hypothetical protein